MPRKPIYKTERSFNLHYRNGPYAQDSEPDNLSSGDEVLFIEVPAELPGKTINKRNNQSEKEIKEIRKRKLCWQEMPW